MIIGVFWLGHSPKLFTYYTKVYHTCQELFLPQVVRVGEQGRRTILVRLLTAPGWHDSCLRKVGTVLA